MCTAELIVCKSANWSVSQSVRCTEASQFLSQTVCRIGLHASQMTSQIVSMLHRKPDSQSTISQSARQFLTWSVSQSVSQSLSKTGCMLDSVYLKQKVSQSVSWSVSLTVCTAELIVCKSANWSVSQSVRCTEASQFLSQTVCRIGLHASQMTSQIVSMLHRKPDSQSTISQSARQFLTWSVSQSVSQSLSKTGCILHRGSVSLSDCLQGRWQARQPASQLIGLQSSQSMSSCRPANQSDQLASLSTHWSANLPFIHSFTLYPKFPIRQ